VGRPRALIESAAKPTTRRAFALVTSIVAIAGIGAGDCVRRAVLSRINEAASWAAAEGAITPTRAEQIARHVRLAVGSAGQPVAA
jgi:hypothetical protein